MPAWDNIFGLGLVGFALCAVLGVGMLVALPVWLYHCREVLRMKGTNTKEVQKLRERLEVLEKRCVKLEEQVATAHMLIADEQRALDKKLSQIVPEGATIPDDVDDSPALSNKRERARD